MEAEAQYTIYAAEGNIGTPGTLTIEGPLKCGRNEETDTAVCEMYTTVGIENILENPELKQRFAKVAKSVIRRQMKPGDAMSLINVKRPGDNEPIVSFVDEKTTLPQFHLIHVICKYGEVEQAKIARPL